MCTAWSSPELAPEATSPPPIQSSRQERHSLNVSRPASSRVLNFLFLTASDYSPFPLFFPPYPSMRKSDGIWCGGRAFLALAWLASRTSLFLFSLVSKNRAKPRPILASLPVLYFCDRLPWLRARLRTANRFGPSTLTAER